MSPRRNKKAHKAVEKVKDEIWGLTQEPVQQLVKLVLQAYEEGINVGRNSLSENEKVDITNTPEKEEDFNRKNVLTEEEDSDRDKNFKRKWKYDKYKPEVSQSKKKKAFACIKCGKNHMGVCLKGRGVCYVCHQQGHIAPQCLNSKKKRCFVCGAQDHQMKDCPKKKGVVKE